jgi:membrane dipeptidase
MEAGPAMPIDWTEIAATAADALDGQIVEITGWPATAETAATARYLLMTPEPACCAGCLPSNPLACVEVFASKPLPTRSGPLTLRGRWRRLLADPNGWRYQLRGAEMLGEDSGSRRHWLSRRNVLAAPLICLPTGSAWASVDNPVVDPGLDAARALLADSASVDVHSHGGSVLHLGRAEDQKPFSPLAEPMTSGGLAVVCLAVVSDQPTHRVDPDGRIRAFRNPEPGELSAYAERGFRRLHALARAQGLAIITDYAGLAAARAHAPSVLVAAEGADFLEGNIAYLQTAYDLGKMRHLQLTHYRVNELGDIQTEAPIHGGLTPFGVDVIRRCQEMGVIVDVAHGTEDLVRKAVEVTTKPLVLSHTSLTAAPRPFTRLITAEHARLVAQTGGVIGIWPPTSVFADLDAMAQGVARMADAVGADHVGVGSDMMGLVVPSALPGYERLPELAAALLKRFTKPEVAGIMGGNYLRVAKACLR